jgi:hypothetical protein
VFSVGRDATAFCSRCLLAVVTANFTITRVHRSKHKGTHRIIRVRVCQCGYRMRTIEIPEGFFNSLAVKIAPAGSGTPMPEFVSLRKR